MFAPIREQVQWTGHGGFRLPGPPLIYINPWRVSKTTFLADVILIGHEHYEHFSLADIEKLRGPDTQIYTNAAVAAQLDGAQVLRPWHSVNVDRARITAVPAYSPTDMRHPVEAGGLGFLISLNFYDIYYAGDTQRIPEMDRVQPDLAILPIDGSGTLTMQEAAEVVKVMRPRYTMPCNWGMDGIATSAPVQAALDFKAAVAGRSDVILPDWLDSPPEG